MPKDTANAPTTFVKSRGIRFPYDPRVIDQRRAKLLRNNAYEAKETRAVLKMVKPEDTVIELGAGMGYMSSVMALKCKAKEVHAFEANPAMIPYIASVHKENDVQGVTVHNALLAPKKAKPANFYVRGDFVASSLNDDLGDESGGVVSVEKVDVLSVKTVFREIKPTVLVCDIEGGELDLFEHIDFSGIRVVVLELHPKATGREGVNTIFRAMMDAGLSYYTRLSHAKVVTFTRGL